MPRRVMIRRLRVLRTLGPVVVATALLIAGCSSSPAAVAHAPARPLTSTTGTIAFARSVSGSLDESEIVLMDVDGSREARPTDGRASCVDHVRERVAASCGAIMLR